MGGWSTRCTRKRRARTTPEANRTLPEHFPARAAPDRSWGRRRRASPSMAGRQAHASASGGRHGRGMAT
eukprot:11092013-Alexandrium_andersonii.AAC.1